MNDLFLGIIAFAVLVMAIIQVAAVVFAVSAARKLGQAADRLEHDIRPLVQNLQTMTAEAARATRLAAAQIDRADRLLNDFGRRVDQIVSAVPAFLGPAGKGLAFLNGIKAALAAIQELRRNAATRRRGPTAEEEDALFIG